MNLWKLAALLSWGAGLGLIVFMFSAGRPKLLERNPYPIEGSDFHVKWDMLSERYFFYRNSDGALIFSVRSGEKIAPVSILPGKDEGSFTVEFWDRK